VSAKAHLKVSEERFAKKMVLKLCHMRGRRIKDTPVSSEIEVGICRGHGSQDRRISSIGFGMRRVICFMLRLFFVGIKAPAYH
jgi:hypothetical protein